MSKAKKRTLTILIIILISAILSAGGLIIYFSLRPAEEASNGVTGEIKSGWDISDEVKKSTPSSGVQIPGYSAAVMNAGDKSLKISVGNPKDNACGFYAALKLDDGTVLYESELLKPGYGTEEIPLNKTLEKGEYKAMIEYRCVTLDEEEKPLNKADSAFVLVVN